jgi:hypothetical protein
MNTLKAIAAAGILCGVLDGLSAIALTLALGGKIARLFQGIAAGVGAKSVAMGVALHFVVALGAAAVYFAASRALPFMIDDALGCGVLYGVIVHFFMNFVVIPMSAIRSRPFVPRVFCAVLAIHMVVVGPSIALTIRAYSR